MNHITKKEVSRIRKRVQVRTQARKRASVIRDRKKNKSRRGVYTKKRKVMLGGNNIDDDFSRLITPQERFDFAMKNPGQLSEANELQVFYENYYDDDKIKKIEEDLVKNRPINNPLKIAINKRKSSINKNSAKMFEQQQPQPQFNNVPQQNVNAFQKDVQAVDNQNNPNTKLVSCICHRAGQGRSISKSLVGEPL